MHFRLSLWTALLACAFMTALRAQTPSPAPATLGDITAPGQIVAKKVTGNVTILVNGVVATLHENDAVTERSVVTTAPDSSVVLVFSNGATTQLGADTSLDIEQFVQDPFSNAINAGALTAEPTRSKTKLRLSKGELVGHVAHLHHEQGSEFTVSTPVGAAGIRGTTFRIVFRPTGTGQAFALFSLSTIEGNVNFQQGAPGTSPNGNPSPGQTPTTPGGQTPPGTSSPSGGVSVSTSQEIVVTVSVQVDPKTNAITVTAPPVVTSTQPIPEATKVAVIALAENAMATAKTTDFSASSGSSSNSGQSTATPSTSSDKKDDTKTDDTKKSDSSGNGSNGASTPDTKSGPTSGTTNSTNPSNSQSQVSTTPASPLSTTPPPIVTPFIGNQ